MTVEEYLRERIPDLIAAEKSAREARWSAKDLADQRLWLSVGMTCSAKLAELRAMAEACGIEVPE